MEPSRTVSLPEELKNVLEKRGILEGDLCRTIDHAEESGEYIEDHSNGHRIASLTLAHATCWVEYSEHEGSYAVHNAYSHRLAAKPEEVSEVAAER